MSASTATTTGSNTPANKVNASATLSEDESFHKRAAEAEAKHVANVATQNRKLEMVEKKLNEKLSSNGKALVLKDKPTRPTHRPTRKNRKPLSPPSNKEHDTRTAAVDIKATIKEKRQLAILLTSRPSLNYDRIIEQHVVNGVVERITQPDNSQHTSVVNKTLPTYSYVDIVEQRVVNNVSERIPGSADTPQAAASNIDTDSDSAAESDNDTEEHVPKLVQEASTAHQSTDSLLERSSSVKAASATASSHVYDDVSMIDVDNEALLLSFANEAALAAAPVELPVTAFKDQKPNKAKEKDAKASDLLKEVAMVDLEVPQKQLKLDTARTATGNADPTTLADDGYVTALLKMPNGPGVTRKSRNFHEKQVAMHITPFALPVTAPKQDKTLKANQKVVKVGGKKIVSCETDESDFVASLLSKPTAQARGKRLTIFTTILFKCTSHHTSFRFLLMGKRRLKGRSLLTPLSQSLSMDLLLSTHQQTTQSLLLAITHPMLLIWKPKIPCTTRELSSAASPKLILSPSIKLRTICSRSTFGLQTPSRSKSFLMTLPQ